MERIPNYVDGESVAPRADRWLDNIEPATGHRYSLVAASDARRRGSRGGRGARALPGWSATPAGERSRLLLAVADRIERDLERFARAESIDTGKPLALARAVDIPRAVANFRFFATAILHAASEAHATDDQALNYTLRRPRGVVGLISPWNLPLYLLTWKIAPALASGNTAVAKPSELTPMTASPAWRASAARPGSRPACSTSCTGRATRGRRRARRPSRRCARSRSPAARPPARRSPGRAARCSRSSSLELGGKNPTIVFADADLDARACPRACARRSRTRARSACAARGSSSSDGVRAVRRALRRGHAAPVGRRPARADDRPGRARLAGPPRQGPLLRRARAARGRDDPVRRRRSGRLARALPRRLLPRADGDHRPAGALPRQPGGDLRTGRDASRRSTTRTRRSRWPTARRTAWRRSVWTENLTRAHRLGRAARGRHACGSTAGCCATCACRSAG